MAYREAVVKILSVEIIQVSRGKAFDALKKSLDEIQNKRGLIKLGIENIVYKSIL